MFRLLVRSSRGFAAAMQLLTRIPVPLEVPYDQGTMRASAVSFPLAGAAVGLVTAASAAALLLLLPAWPAAALTLAVWTAVTGGLHLDGWIDTADGTLSNRPRERMLEIMKDSRVGAMGAMAGVLLLIVKFAALASLLESAGPACWAMLAAIPVWSRWWMTAAMAAWPNARGEGGMGALFRGVRAVHAGGAAAAGLAVTFALLCAGGAAPIEWVGLPAPGAAALAAAAFPALAAAFGWPLGRWLARRLGGQTGDTYGAMNEWTEAWLLLALSALYA
jgi:adenosylcobinamide-GDP ribazoletransferase